MIARRPVDKALVAGFLDYCCSPNLFFCLLDPPPSSTLFPYTTLFRSVDDMQEFGRIRQSHAIEPAAAHGHRMVMQARSEEHTSELQSHSDIVCRLLLEKKKN